MNRTPTGEHFFHRLARIIANEEVLNYIDYQPDIPQNMSVSPTPFLSFQRSRSIYFSYALIHLCLVEDDRRPEMTRLRALLCHSKMLSKRAFQVVMRMWQRSQHVNRSRFSIIDWNTIVIKKKTPPTRLSNDLVMIKA
jgi:hypothetical protein